jgi:chromosome segregation ATPase
MEQMKEYSREELKRLLKDLRTKLVDTESALDRALASREHRVEDAREGMRVAMQRAEKAEAALTHLRAHADRLQSSLDKLDNPHSFE